MMSKHFSLQTSIHGVRSTVNGYGSCQTLLRTSMNIESSFMVEIRKSRSYMIYGMEGMTSGYQEINAEMLSQAEA